MQSPAWSSWGLRPFSKLSARFSPQLQCGCVGYAITGKSSSGFGVFFPWLFYDYGDSQIACGLRQEVQQHTSVFSLSLCSQLSVLQTQKHCQHSVDTFPLFTSFHFYLVSHGREEQIQTVYRVTPQLLEPQMYLIALDPAIQDLLRVVNSSEVYKAL